MDISAYTVEAGRLWAGEAAWDAPIAFIDLDVAGDVPDRLALPPCPVIGVGNPGHVLALHLDAIVESPATADAILRQVLAAPRAAAVTVQLLRLVLGLTPEEGLAAESFAYGLLQGSEEHRAWLQSRSDTPPRTEGRITQDRSGDCLNITLDHPETGNAIDRAMRDALYDAFTLAGLDPEIRHISLRGAGRTFSLGAELGEFGTTTDPATAHAIRCLTLPARAVASCADKLHVHVQGGCVGAGLELAGWARRLTATRDAWFHLPELSMGILPGAGGCVSLTRRMGRQRTALIILSGKRISAQQALSWGMIDAIVDHAPGGDGGTHVA